METEVELLELLIKAETKTLTAFAEKIGMTRQNLTRIIREANKKEGVLPASFKYRLEEFGLNPDRFKRQPTYDFVENFRLSHLEEHKNAYSKDEKLIELLEEKVKRLEDELRKLRGDG